CVFCRRGYQKPATVAFDTRKHLEKMKRPGWLLLLFREEAAVPVAVYEGICGRITVLSRPLQAPSGSQGDVPRRKKHVVINERAIGEVLPLYHAAPIPIG